MVIVDPRQYSDNYPKSNIIIRGATDYLNKIIDLKQFNNIIKCELEKNHDLAFNLALHLAPNFMISQLIWQTIHQIINNSNNIFIAIPLILVIGAKTKQTIPNILIKNTLNNFFHQYSIIDSNVFEYHIKDILAHPDTIKQLKLSQMYHFSHDDNQQLNKLPFIINDNPCAVINEGVFIRFFIGNIKSKCLNNENYLSNINDNLQKNIINYQNWQKNILNLTKILNEQLADKNITLYTMPFYPSYLSNSLFIADNYHKEISLQIALSNIIKKIRQQQLTPSVFIVYDNFQLHINVNTSNDHCSSIKINNNLVDMSILQENLIWRLSPYDDYTHIFTLITNLLLDMQVKYYYEQ